MNKYELLEERALQFAKRIAIWSSFQNKKLENSIFLRQLIRSSSSIGANYIEANESLGSRDQIYRIKICRKEAKETQYWLRLLSESVCSEDQELLAFLQECSELRKIFSAIILSLEKNSAKN